MSEAPYNNLLDSYLGKQLAERLRKHIVVVWYDPRTEFQPFVYRLCQSSYAAGEGGMQSVHLHGMASHLCQYRGSFFEVRATIEPYVCVDRPEPLLVYLPGVERDRQGSVLMELEKGGTCYEPQLKRLALNVLRKQFTDGQIDEMLRPAHVTYDDIVAFLEQGREGQSASVLRTLFAGAASEVLLTRWLADTQQDSAIVDKDAVAELYKLIETRLGLPVPGGTTVTEVRDKTLRYVLVSEFCADLGCEPPSSVSLEPPPGNQPLTTGDRRLPTPYFPQLATGDRRPSSVSMVPTPPTGEHGERIRDVATGLRHDFAERYVALADRVATDLGLQDAEVDAAHLGMIDTFRFEEQRLLRHTGALIAVKKYDAALALVTGRRRSFWVDRDVTRQAQWEACRLLAELGCAIARVRPVLGKMGTDPAKWLVAYTTDEGWYRVDSLQRWLETWVAKMDEEPEAEQALGVVRRDYEELLKRMADGFSQALKEAGWTIPGALHQTHIYPDVVQGMGGRVAYFFVDAMRFEMGVELARQLQGTTDLTVRPAIAALPSITPVGMAALLPGASASFSVVEHKGELAARIEGSVMPGLHERLKFLKAKVPDTVEMTLGKLLGTPPSKLGKAISNASLVVIRSQEIDFVGEMDGDLLAHQVMGTIIGNLARAVKKLANVGMANFVITADHGHQFSIRKDEDMRTDNPGGNTVDLHRRCWIGHGGTTPPGSVRITGAELGYDSALDFVFPTGLGVFKAGGGLSFHHGSFSLQELVIPVVRCRVPRRDAPAPPGKRVQLSGVPDTLTNRTFGVRVLAVADLFTTEPVALRVVLVAGHEQVGQAGMVLSADFDRTTGILHIHPGTEASVGIMLTRDDCQKVRIVVLDPATDAVLEQSDEIPVKLGI